MELLVLVFTLVLSISLALGAATAFLEMFLRVLSRYR